jgi:hypothetical protein
MDKRFALTAAAFLLLPMLAHASCDDVKSAIDQKIKAKGVAHYSLDVVAADQADSSGGKVVGSCEGGKKIVYTKGTGSSGDTGTSAPAAGSSTHAPASSSSS